MREYKKKYREYFGEIQEIQRGLFQRNTENIGNMYKGGYWGEIWKNTREISGNTEIQEVFREIWKYKGVSREIQKYKGVIRENMEEYGFPGVFSEPFELVCGSFKYFRKYGNTKGYFGEYGNIEGYFGK